MIVPVAPGGGADITARALAQRLTELWGQQVIIDNRAGAGGIVGLEMGARAAPDGYTITQASDRTADGDAGAAQEGAVRFDQGLRAHHPRGVGDERARRASFRIRTIALTSAQRSDLLPGVPTVAESGVPGFAIENWYGFVFPAGTPKPIVTQTHREMNRILALPEMKDRLSPLGIVHFPTATPEEFGAYIRSEMKKYAELVKAAGIVAD